MPLRAPHLLGTLDLLQEGAQLPGLGVEGSAHSLVVVGGIGGTGQVRCAQLEGERDIVGSVLQVYQRQLNE